MFTRIRIATGIAVAALLLPSVSVFAKGGFDFIKITGPGLEEAMRVTDPGLSADFFTFADFSTDRTNAPADPGKGYEITRHYVRGASDVIFDRLHYYPETGFVFYDGIENGDSEYDGEWYTANPEIKTAFESALGIPGASVAPAEKKVPVTTASQAQPEESVAQAKPVAATFPSSLVLMIVFSLGMAALFTFVSWRRKPSAQ